jgi:hypothetical protein
MNYEPNYFTIINSFTSAIFGGVSVAVINFLLNRARTKAEIDKMAAEREKLLSETEKLHLETDSLRVDISSRMSVTEKRLDWTEEAVRKVVAYRPGYFAHQILCQIRDKADEYYEDLNSHKKRLLLLLLDNGYLQPPAGKMEIVFSPEVNGLRLFEIAELSPMATLMLKLREEISKRSA